ncbi:MAG: hypothetical protein Fur0039_10030 [Rhodocyclaceae bacterium]
MPLLSHELEQEFPELKHVIQALRGADTQFARLCEEYKRIDADVSRVEENDEPVPDHELERLKKKRLRVKDALYAMLRAQRV